MPSLFYERLRELMHRSDLNQTRLSELTGIDVGTISRWKTRGTTPKKRTLLKLSEALQCSIDELAGEQPAPHRREIAPKHTSRLVPVVAIPLLGKVPAGIPEQIEEQVEDYVSFPGVSDGTYALRAHGESMVPSIRHDDFVLFRIDQDARPGHVVVVNNEFGESMLKRLKEKNGELWLTSDNPEYPAVRPNAHYRIMGVVVRVIRDIPF